MARKNDKTTSKPLGGTQVGSTQQGENDPDRTGIAKTQSERVGHDRERLLRNGCKAGVEILFGGILAQLIEDGEDSLRESEECVAWYEREVAKKRKRLENLKALKAEIESLENEAE